MVSPSLIDIRKRLNKINVLHRLYFYKRAAKYNLYFGQMPILEFVKNHDNCTQRDVADFLQVSPPSIATSIKRMQKAGLLEKSADDKDLRYNRIRITDKGREISEKCRKDLDAVDEMMLSGFNEQECELLNGFLDRIINNLSVGEFANKTFFSLIAEEKKIKERHIREEEE